MRITSDYALNNVVENDELEFEQKVDSSAPSTLTSFAGFGIALIITIGLLGLTNQNEKYRLGAVYSGIIMLGFLFHLYDAIWWGPMAIVLVDFGSGEWLGVVAKSSDTFTRIINEHGRVFLQSMRSLPSTDGLPPTTDDYSQPSALWLCWCCAWPTSTDDADEANLISLVGYILFSTIVVWFILRRANKIYGTLYGKLTDIEVKATRIERDLGDPARLLNDLAMDGLDLSAILDAPQSVASSDGQNGSDSNEEVMSNGEEQG